MAPGFVFKRSNWVPKSSVHNWMHKEHQQDWICNMCVYLKTEVGLVDRVHLFSELLVIGLGKLAFLVQDGENAGSLEWTKRGKAQTSVD